MPTFVDWLHQLVPTWLQGPGGTAMTTVIGSELDRATDLVRQAVQARFPGLAPLDGLKKLGEERGIPKADWETDGDYAAYLVRAWDAWLGTDAAGGGAGTPISILIAAHRLLGGGFTLAQDLAGDPQAAALVQWNGRFVQLYKDFRTPIFGTLDGCMTHGPPAFLPTGLGSTLKLWLRADLGVATGVSLNVVSVADQSGNGNDVQFSSGTPLLVASAISGRPGFGFNGGSDLLSNSTSNLFSAGSARTIFVVSKATTEAGGPLVESRRASGVRATYLQGGSGFGAFANGVYTDTVDTSRDATISPRTITGVPTISEFTCAAAPAPLTMRINGILQSLTQTNPCDAETGSAGYSIGRWSGSAQSYVGSICEIIVCDTVLSDTNAAKVRAYLANRYQIGLTPQPGWYDGTDYWSRSWLVLPTPGGVITKVDDDGTLLTLGNDAGNILKARLNAEVMRWKGAREAYGGAFVTDSYNPRLDSGAPPGSDLWWVAQSAPVSYMMGWPPSSLDANHVLGDGFILDGISSLHIDPP